MSTQTLMRRYYLISFLVSLNFELPIWVLFGHDYLGLSYFTGIMLISLPNLVGTFFDVPMGALADRWGRNHTFKLGIALSILGFLPLALTKDVTLLFVFAPLAGLGTAMRTGCLDAIVSTALADRHDQFSTAASNQRVTYFTARLIGSVIGSALYVADPRLPFAADVAALTICLALAWNLPSNTKHAVDVITKGAIRQALRVVRNDSGLRTLFVFVFLEEILGNLTYITYQPALESAGFSHASFGFIFAMMSACSIAGSIVIRRWITTTSVATLVQLFFVATAISSLSVTVASGWWFLVGTIPLQFALGTLFPLSATYTASRSPAHIKATVLSLLSFVLGMWVIASIATGALLDHTSIRSIGVLVAATSTIVALAVPRHLLNHLAIPRAVASDVKPAGAPSNP